MASSKGTDNGMLRNVGRRTVRAGTNNIGFDGWGWSSNHASFVFSMIVMEVRKRTHSMKMLVRLIILILRLYQLVAMGQSSCVPLVR